MDTLTVDQIIKINGVSPSALAKLHKVLDGPQVRSRYQRDHVSNSDILYAELLNTKWNKDFQTYTVEIQLRMKEFPRFGIIDGVSGESARAILYAPFSILRAIYDVLGFYPDVEQIVYSEEPSSAKS